MKKNFFYALMSAIALTGAIGFTACSSDSDAVVENNPTYDGTGVRTDFAFNITKASKGTRMSDVNVQENDNPFLGMSHMYLFPFKEVPADAKTTNIANPYNYALGELTTSEISSSSSKKIYSLTLPVGTNNFLFYGTATRGSKTGFEAGRLSSSFYTKTGAKESGVDVIASTDDIHFNLVNIADGLGTDATKLAAYLNVISSTTGWAGTVGIANGTTSGYDNPGAYKALADLYLKFTQNSKDRCGSAEAVLRTLSDLYKSAAAINGQSSVTEVKTIANAICTSITSGTVDMSIRVDKPTATATDPDTWTFAYQGTLSDESFPSGTLKLPMGAAHLYCNNGTFSYVDPNATSTTSSDGVAFTNICYPSELVYFDNSPLRATDTYKTAADFPSTPATWDEKDKTSSSLGFTSDWTDTEVKATTRAVAMTNNVNYGVALLETNVKLAQTSLTDNMAAIVGGTAENQTTINGTKFKVTGLLIGGQPKQVGWNMVKTSGSDFSGVIYDNDVPFKETALSEGYFTNNNYTLVLDNFNENKLASSERQPDVNIALQLKNDGDDFYGANGIIPAGSTFYLVGKLDLQGKSLTSATRKDTYRITRENITRVFVQDYKTVANITISADALQKAYSSIPDLRSTEIVFGLSVEMKWEAGITFNVEL